MRRLVSEYLQLAPSDLVQDSVELLCGEPLVRMAHTHDGAAAGAAMLGWASAKQRKKAVKAMKGHTVKMCLDEFAYIPLVQALACIDDTQLVRKGVIAELTVRCCSFSLLCRCSGVHCRTCLVHESWSHVGKDDNLW
jgi:pumilio homology domain family member 6